MKIIKFIIIVILVTMLFACQSNQDLILSFEKKLVDLSISNDSLKNQIIELKKENQIIKLKNDELQMMVSTLEDKYISEEIMEHSVAAYSNGIIRFIETKETISTYFTLILIGYNTSLYDEPFEVIDFSNDEIPTAKFKVFGTLYNFKIVKVVWNSDYSDYIISEEICSFEKVTNKSIVFNSVLAEGYPDELLIWENEDGEIKNYKISNDGYGFTTQVLICDEYSN